MLVHAVLLLYLLLIETSKLGSFIFSHSIYTQFSITICIVLKMFKFENKSNLLEQFNKRLVDVFFLF